MEEIINEIVPAEDLKKYEKLYHQELDKGNVSQKAQFEYAWCLVRSKYPTDIRRGILLLEDLSTRFSDSKRDYIYFLTIAHTRVKEYSMASKYVKVFLDIEPNNVQMIALREYINDKLVKEGRIGMALVGGAALVLGGLVSIGVALSKKQ